MGPRSGARRMSGELTESVEDVKRPKGCLLKRELQLFFLKQSLNHLVECGSNVLDVEASLSLTLPLYGVGGFLNQRVVDQAQLARDQAELNAQNSTNSDLATIYQLMITIKRDEDTIKNNRQNLENSSAVLDNLFSELSSGNVSRLELRDALIAARDSDLALLDSNVSHSSDKFALAQLIGVDRLPGDLY